jgi:hypothetical protein
MTETENAIGKEFCRECFEYKDGALHWRERPRHHFKRDLDWLGFNRKLAGKPAGRHAQDGYITIKFRLGQGSNGSLHLSAHRVVWMLCTGEWPQFTIDHMNRVRNDNRIENLRDVPMDENLRNNGKDVGTGLRGVRRKHGKFGATVKVGINTIHLGSFDTPEEALGVRERAENAALSAALGHRQLAREGRRTTWPSGANTVPHHTPMVGKDEQ